MKNDQLRPGDEVRTVRSDRPMVVRSVEDGLVHCCWFDGRREATLMRDAVRPSSGTRDDRLYQV